MQKHAGFILALASAAPAVANGAVETRPVAATADGISLAATSRAQGVTAALDEGRALLAAGNAAQAISAFRLALSADQGSVPALNGLAIAYDRLGRVDLARQHFEMALAVQPDAADIAYNLGLTLHLAGDHRAAVPWLQKAAGGTDGRAATAARRVLLVIAARLEAEAAGSPALAQPLAPARVASARIDMASSGEAVLV
ncbi:tetratricopeptide repeat protein, partial [Sandarakinorhabdus rubra]|uniref:tetratricopeptide repeat protein n=1 Tax=Sandarakinorhabdus rubra TaxID=2672568 RepID=UPI0013D987E5